MKHDNQNTANLATKLKRREFMVMMAGCTAGLMVPGLFPGEGNILAASAPTSDRLGQLLPLRKLGVSGPAVTNLGVGGDHVGSASEKNAQAIIEKALEEGVRFFDNAPFYSNGKSEERYGKILTPRYRDVAFVMTKTLAYGRFFGGSKGWRRTGVAVKPIIPDVLSVADVFGFVWSLPVTTLVSGMESVRHVSQNAALARQTWDWNQAERQKRIDAVAPIAGPDLEFYKS